MASPLAASLLRVSCSSASTSAPKPTTPKQSSSTQAPRPAAAAAPVPSLRAIPTSAAAMAAALPLLAALTPPEALAVGGELGILEGRVRTIQDDISDLKKQLKPSAVPAAKVAAGADSSSSAPPPPPAPKSPLEIQIDELTEERKKLVKGSFRDRHFNAGSILLGLGVAESVGGALNTWMRTGKLFPGPHLFAGAAITVLWAAAAALVPAMQKGNETARSLHIALNAVNVLLFVWQIPTGLEIVGKVFEFTNWP